MDDLGDGIERKIPVYLGEGHYQIFDYIMKYIEEKHIPKHGNTIIRLGAHVDKAVPLNKTIKMFIESDYDMRPSYYSSGLQCTLKKLNELEVIKRVIWIKPPWAKQVRDEIGIVCENASKNKLFTMDVLTLGKEIFEVDQKDDYNKFKILARDYLKNKEPYILDIHLHFFSSDTSARTIFPKIPNYYDIVQDIFAIKLPENDDPESMEIAVKKRMGQLDELKDIFNHLQMHRKMPPNENTSEYYKKVSELHKALLDEYPEDDFNWNMIWEFGCSSGPYQLPVHVTKHKDVMKMIKHCFGKIMDSLPHPPAVILISRTSEYVGYVSPDEITFIEQNVLSYLKKKFNLDKPDVRFIDD